MTLTQIYNSFLETANVADSKELKISFFQAMSSVMQEMLTSPDYISLADNWADEILEHLLNTMNEIVTTIK